MGLSETAAFALETAREAAALVMGILPESRVEKQVRLKTATDLVTRADHEAERLIAARIRARFPDHGMLGEEGTTNDGTGPCWVVDPVDGTANFAHGVPWFAVSIALEYRGAVQCGVIAVPPLDEYFVAERGRGAYLLAAGAEPVRMEVSETADLGAALVATGLPREPDRSWHVQTIGPLILRSLEVRIMGAAAIHLAYLAAGRLDAFWEPGLQPWDVAAGVLLVEEAGGRVSDWSGRPLVSLKTELLASNGPLHPAMVQALAGYSRAHSPG
ncbi:MAG: inositol monophosphatase [Armatimonadetes bacterium]|nr:inositol monophosphatase [Armatimonadota bacterium]